MQGDRETAPWLSGAPREGPRGGGGRSRMRACYGLLPDDDLAVNRSGPAEMRGRIERIEEQAGNAKTT